MSVNATVHVKGVFIAGVQYLDIYTSVSRSDLQNILTH